MAAPHPALTQVRARYDRWAPIYDHDRNPLPPLEEPHVRAALGDVRGRTVLDLGCGTGRHTRWLAREGARVTAVDFSEGMLCEARCRPAARQARFVRHDLHLPLPFIDRVFDVAVSGLVLEHLASPRHFFAEIRRVLRPCGRAVVSTQHPAMSQRDSRARFTDPVSGELVEPGSLPHSMDDITGAAGAAGLRIIHVSEHAPDGAFAARFPRCEKYVGYPMLLVLVLDAASSGAGGRAAAVALS